MTTEMTTLDLDRRLRRCAAARAVLDAEEAGLLRQLDRRRCYRELGHPTMLAYMEAVLGYSPKVALERLRVAYAVEDLPLTLGELQRGRLSYSAVRELSRVATAVTEQVWLAATAGQSLRQIERAVAGRAKGDLPTDPRNSDLRIRTVSLDLAPATYALLREVRKVTELEVGHRLTDDELVAVMCRSVLEGGNQRDAGRASHQIALTLCEQCDRATEDGGGITVDVPASAVSRARCDAQHLGRVDGASPTRARQDIPPAVRRQVYRRDHGRCTVPGCRSSRYLEIHHIVAREGGGTHEARNLTLLCGAHHQLLHDHGGLAISGEAPARLTFELAESWRTMPAAELERLLDPDRWRGCDDEEDSVPRGDEQDSVPRGAGEAQLAC
jgi:hypothetical protein